MKNLPALLILVLLAGSALFSRDLYYPGETIPVPPFKFTVKDLKYSQGSKFNKPPEGFLFLVMRVQLANPSSEAARFRWREWLTVSAGQSEYVIDTVRNFQAQQNRTLEAGSEKTITLWYMVPKVTYETGARANLVYKGKKYGIDLRFADAYDGHLAAGLAWAEKKDYAKALGEYRLATGYVQPHETERNNYLTYRIGEAYGKLFLYEEALAEFTRILNLGMDTKFYKESKGNFDLLKYKLNQEKKNDRAVRLAEAGYNCAFQLGDEKRGLEIFKQLMTEYAGIKVGAYNTEHVAIMYTILVHMNRRNYVEALSMCQEALTDQDLCKNAEFTKVIKKQMEECQNPGDK